MGFVFPTSITENVEYLAPVVNLAREGTCCPYIRR